MEEIIKVVNLENLVDLRLPIMTEPLVQYMLKMRNLTFLDVSQIDTIDPKYISQIL